jgi:CBS domain-containing protein
MTAKVEYAEPDESLAVVARRMADDRLGCMPIMQAGHLVGIVTTADYLTLVESTYDAA